MAFFETLIGDLVTTAGNHRCILPDGGGCPGGMAASPSTARARAAWHAGLVARAFAVLEMTGRGTALRSLPGCPGSTTGHPGIGVAGRRTRGREGCSVARALQPSVVVAGAVDLIGKERGLRDRVRQSLPGTRGAAWVAQRRWHLAAGGDRQAEWAYLRVGPRSGSVETGAEVVAVWSHGDG